MKKDGARRSEYTAVEQLAFDYLQAASDCHIRIRTYRGDIEYLREFRRSIAATVYDNGKTAALFIDLEQEQERKAAAYEKQLQEAARMIDAFAEAGDNQTDAEIFRRRYIDCEIWEDIADAMFYTGGYVQKRHRKALQAFGEWLTCAAAGDIAEAV